MVATAVDRVLLEHAGDPRALFVFPTEIALNRWAERTLRLRGGGSLAMDRFTAWDRFKRDSIRSRIQDRRAIPPALRKIFAGRLLEENARALREGGEGIFNFLIPPRYAAEGLSFGPWLSRTLPQLGGWFRRAAGKEASEIRGEDSPGFDEGEDRDLFSLTLHYGEFLKKHGLFEPAWEKPPFDDQGRECFIFFPEALSDFSEYEALLEGAPHVRILSLAGWGELKPCRGFFYTNARSEITEAALYIRNLVEKEGVPWENIVVSVPEGENYEPYAAREFANRGIPVVRRAGKALSAYPAGRLFTGIQDCCAQGFSFGPLSNLLLNSQLPWKDRETIDQLIDFGIRNNCICSWTEGGREEDVWLDAFRSLAGSREQRAAGYYRELKAAMEKIAASRRFREILWAYFAFRDRFLDIARCSPEADAVLSRCISELLALTELEDSFPGLPAAEPYAFFVEHLGETSYLPQERLEGVSILPYRTAACVPFDCHIVLGSSQDNLSMVFSRLDFLSRTKKEKLSLEDIDASDAFIRLHRLNSTGPAAFFCSAQGFAGFSVPHQGLNIDGEPRLRWAGAEAPFFSPDLFETEERALGGDGKAPLELYQVQDRGFRAWMERRAPPEGPRRTGADLSGPYIAELLRKKTEEQVSVSASALEPYYYCSVRWLYERLLRLESRRMETALMAENVTGSLYHAVLDKFFKALGGTILRFPSPEETAGGRGTAELSSDYSRFLASAVREVFEGLPLLSGERVPLSALTSRFLRAQEKTVQRQLELLLGTLLLYFEGCRVEGSELNRRLEKEDYCLTGKIDLLLRDERGETESPGGVIVDFKLSRLPKRKPCTGEGGLENFQLPMYITLAEAAEGEDAGKESGGEESSRGESVGTALFFSILKTETAVIFGRIRDKYTGKRKPARQAILRGGEDGRFEAVMEEFRAKVRSYAGDMREGKLAPPNAGEERCGPCAYRRVCRTLYTVAGDRSWIPGEAKKPEGRGAEDARLDAPLDARRDVPLDARGNVPGKSPARELNAK
ncbi:MAG: PD-(D/E)XK nuclease family protein [Treponema sp.]|nr:PD-(D/E)XK nuclease family protein [Treponema sp.]